LPKLQHANFINTNFMQKLTNKASVKSIFNTRIAVLLDFLTLAQTPQTEKLLIKRKI